MPRTSVPKSYMHFRFPSQSYTRTKLPLEMPRAQSRFRFPLYNA